MTAANPPVTARGYTATRPPTKGNHKERDEITASRKRNSGLRRNAMEAAITVVEASAYLVSFIVNVATLILFVYAFGTAWRITRRLDEPRENIRRLTGR
jgi:hypothetical protein